MLRDLKIISEYYGRSFMPYPFMQTKPDDFADLDAYEAYATSVPDRYNHGDLHESRKWFTTYLNADLRVECSVQYLDDADAAGLRMVAHRLDDVGYLAIQQPDDSVEVFTLSPYDLGAAVAGSVGLTTPGKHPAIVVPEYAARSIRSDDVAAVTRQRSAELATTVRRTDVTVFARVQSHWKPVRDWGFDRTKSAVVWVRLDNDGEYMYTRDLSCARPVSARQLSERIDLLIAKDIQALRELRGT